jgi:hypothetical protein
MAFHALGVDGCRTCGSAGIGAGTALRSCRRKPLRPWSLLVGALALAGCSAPLPIAHFAGTRPALHPDRWFVGHTHSWGVFENARGDPTGTFTTEDIGTRTTDGTLVLAQTIQQSDGTVLHRTWRLKRVGAHRYTATAGPVVGIGRGEAYGRVFHWTYILRLPPGDWLHTVRFNHWMYLSDDGTHLLNRFTVRKLGIVVARASEVFAHDP